MAAAAHHDNPLFDVFLLFYQEDMTDALKFANFLEESDLNLRVCVFDSGASGKRLDLRNSFDSLQEGFSQSRLTFIYATKLLCTHAPKWISTAVGISLENERNRVVPVRADDSNLPLALCALTSLRFYHVKNILFTPPADLKPIEKCHLVFFKRQIKKILNP